MAEAIDGRRCDRVAGQVGDEQQRGELGTHALHRPAEALHPEVTADRGGEHVADHDHEGERGSGPGGGGLDHRSQRGGEVDRLVGGGAIVGRQQQGRRCEHTEQCRHRPQTGGHADRDDRRPEGETTDPFGADVVAAEHDAVGETAIRRVDAIEGEGIGGDVL